MVTISRDYTEEAFKMIQMDATTTTFVLFGATGDLAKRKIFPALFNLFLDGKIPPSFSIIGIGREEWSVETFQKHVQESLKVFSRRLTSDAAKFHQFLSYFSYHSFDVTEAEGYKQLLATVRRREKELNLAENRLFYLSVAPELVDMIASNIKTSKLGADQGQERLIIEKPFGHNLKSAQDLYEKLTHIFEEDEIFIIDHYLGKPMVQNIEALEFANPILQALWNKDYIANVQITASETVGVENRADYYDQSGAIRDMVQNHMLQLVMMIGMNLPKQISASEIREEKIKIIESLHPLKKEDITTHIIRGQYDSGEVNGEHVVGYKAEPGVPSSSKTDTFIAARLWIDDLFWTGVPFYIRTGKRMKHKSTRIVIEFKNPLEDLYRNHNEKTVPNLLEIKISPNEGISFQINSKNPLHNGKIEPITVHFSADQNEVPEAYELLLYDALRGDSTFFANWKEVELSWKWVQPVLEAYEKDSLPLYPYVAGTMGPEASDRLLEVDGFKWW
jgi:glucose-6-phosphate 1-dehydrogenase